MILPFYGAMMDNRTPGGVGLKALMDGRVVKLLDNRMEKLFDGRVEAAGWPHASPFLRAGAGWHWYAQMAAHNSALPTVCLPGTRPV